MKQLKDMSLEELWQLFPIILKPHNSSSAQWYQDEKISICNIFSADKISRINHIGSTSVKGLIAKPTVDILLEFPSSYNLDEVYTQLHTHGWTLMARDNSDKTLDLNKGYTPQGFAEKVYHLHVKPIGDWGELYFRDYLQSHAAIAREYENLKLELSERFKNNRDGYTQAKTNFIKRYTEKAREEFHGRYTPH